VGILRALNATGTRRVPADAPTGFVPARWRGYLDAAHAAGNTWTRPVTPMPLSRLVVDEVPSAQVRLRAGHRGTRRGPDRRQQCGVVTVPATSPNECWDALDLPKVG